MNNRCPITYELCGTNKYSTRGLKLLSKNLLKLKDFPYTIREQVQLAAQLSSKLSIQGVQPKLSAKLNVKDELFEVVETGGAYILKPPHLAYDELPQNEDLTMKLATFADIEVPVHGMIYACDNSLTYFIKRFDRLPNSHKVAVEDFSQLLGSSRDTKYDSSMEKVLTVVDKHCTFPMIEKTKLFRRTIFNFLTGNEDMHLKNFSLIRRKDKVELSPAYDLVNTTIVLKTDEELALPLKGKKSRLSRDDLLVYYGQERLKLTKEVIEAELLKFATVIPKWKELINISFLSENARKQYIALIDSRWQRLS